ncbi:hypothetical protein MRX96_057726 [Rhipicephalus microplus]
MANVSGFDAFIEDCAVMEVHGKLLTPEEFAKVSRWKTVAAICSRDKSASVKQVGAVSSGAHPNDNVAAHGR